VVPIRGKEIDERLRIGFLVGSVAAEPAGSYRKFKKKF